MEVNTQVECTGGGRRGRVDSHRWLGFFHRSGSNRVLLTGREPWTPRPKGHDTGRRCKLCAQETEVMPEPQSTVCSGSWFMPRLGPAPSSRHMHMLVPDDKKHWLVQPTALGSACFRSRSLRVASAARCFSLAWNPSSSCSRAARSAAICCSWSCKAWQQGSSELAWQYPAAHVMHGP